VEDFTSNKRAGEDGILKTVAEIILWWLPKDRQDNNFGRPPSRPNTYGQFNEL
jgi:hypothetical protein